MLDAGHSPQLSKSPTDCTIDLVFFSLPDSPDFDNLDLFWSNETVNYAVFLGGNIGLQEAGQINVELVSKFLTEKRVEFDFLNLLPNQGLDTAVELLIVFCSFGDELNLVFHVQS